jgi:hypothetical protein
MKADGFRPTDVGAYVLPDGRGELWNGIYEENSFRYHVSYRYRELDVLNRITNLEAKGLEAWAVNT